MGRIGAWLRFPLQFIPRQVAVPILSGPARGMKWVVGAATHGCWLGSYEVQKQLRIASLLQPGDGFLDIGANAGFYTLLASRLVGPSGRVYAFEPVPENIAKIHRHLQLNRVSNVCLYEAAVSDQVGMAVFRTADAGECGCLSTDGDLEVETVTLDELWGTGRLIPPRVIKIDVEGAEAKVLRGGAKVIQHSRPTILLAGHGTARQRECEAILESFGYVVTIERDGSEDGMYESLAMPASP